MFLHRVRRALVALAFLLPTLASAGFTDVLDTPAGMSPLASKGLLNGVALAGKRLIAVGQRGHIVYSDDAGSTWRQATVPVSSDLVAVSFPTPQQGWAVGHDGVVLHSSDGGATWERQLDGRRVGPLMVQQFRAQAARGELGSTEDATKLIDEVGRLAAQGAENPFLDVWFADEHNGFIVGAFNLIFQTTDGGKTWVSWFDRTENPDRLHLYAVRGVGSDVYIVGEQGLLLKLDHDNHRFHAITTPYKGTYFGVVGNSDAVIVYGLRGNAYRYRCRRGAHWEHHVWCTGFGFDQPRRKPAGKPGRWRALRADSPGQAHTRRCSCHDWRCHRDRRCAWGENPGVALRRLGDKHDES
jgi:photosystem II stability/assembly factor-like uncharacterized protein